MHHQETLDASAALIAASQVLRTKAVRLRDESVTMRYIAFHARLESQERRLQYMTSYPLPLWGG
jgi:hypothetical protein